MSSFIFSESTKLFLFSSKIGDKIVSTDNLVILILTFLVVWFAKDWFDKNKQEKKELIGNLKSVGEKLESGERMDINIESRIDSMEKSWKEVRENIESEYTTMKNKINSFNDSMNESIDTFKREILTNREDDHKLVIELQQEMSRLIDSRIQPYSDIVKGLSDQVDDFKEVLRLADKEISLLRGELKSHMQFTVFITMAASKVETIDPVVAELVRDILEIPKFQELKRLHRESFGEAGENNEETGDGGRG